LREAQKSGTGINGLPHVLIADGEEDHAAALAAALAEVGFSITVVNSGDQAALKLMSSTVDVLVLQLDIAGLSGLEVMRAARSVDKDLQVVATSSAPSASAVMAAVNAGALAFL